MPQSTASASMLLPFGSLMGDIPVDSLQRGRVLGEFGGVLADPGQCPSEIQHQLHSVIDPFPLVSRGRRPSPRAGGGGS